MIAATQDVVSVSSFERLLKEWGWPAFTLFLLIIGIVVVVRWVAPFLKAYIQALQKHADEAHETLKQTVKDQSDRSARQEKEFINSLTAQREAHIAATVEQSATMKKSLGEVGETIARQLKDQGETIGKAFKEQGESLHEITIILRDERRNK